MAWVGKDQNSKWAFWLRVSSLYGVGKAKSEARIGPRFRGRWRWNDAEIRGEPILDY
jgi:hypothetical protein